MPCTVKAYYDVKGAPSSLYTSLKQRFGEAQALELTIKADKDGYDLQDNDVDKFIDKYSLYQIKPPLTQQQLYDNIIANQELIEKRGSSEGYFNKATGEKVQRVTEYIKKDVYSNRTQLDIMNGELSYVSKMGTANHTIFEYYLNKAINKAKGLPTDYKAFGINTDTSSNFVVNVEGENITVHDPAKRELEKRAQMLYDDVIKIDPNAMILTEIKLYNREKNLAGTADVLVIHSDQSNYAGKISIYDLKTKKYKDEFKDKPLRYNDREYYDNQLQEYYAAAADAGAIGIVRSRVIPLIFQTAGKDIVTKVVEEKDIPKIGSMIVSSIEENSNLNEDVNKLLKDVADKIYRRAKSYSKKKKSENRDYKLEASEIRNIMDDILTDESLAEMFDLFQKENNKDAVDIAFLDQNVNNSSTSRQIYDKVNEIRDRLSLQKNILELLNDAKKSGTDKQKALVDAYDGEIKFLRNNIYDLSSSLDRIDATQLQIDGVEKKIPEVFAKFKQISQWTKNVLSFSDINIPLFNLLRKYVADAEAKVHMKNNEAYERMKKFDGYLKDISKELGRNIGWDIFHKNNKLVSKAKKEFWETREEMFDRMRKDPFDQTAKDWFTKNVIFNQQVFDELLVKKQDEVNLKIQEKERRGDFANDTNGNQRAAYRKSIMDNFQKMNNIVDENGNYNPYAYANDNIGYRSNSLFTPSEDNNSDEYTFIKSDPRLFEIYNHFLDINSRVSALSGRRYAYNDLPQINKNKITMLFKDFSMDRLFRALDISNGGDREKSIKINPETGAYDYTIPLSFVEKLSNENELSKDLGKTFFLLEASLNNNEEKSKIEGLALSITHHAKNLKYVKKVGRETIEQEIGQSELQLLEKYINYTIYNVKADENTVVNKVIENLTGYTSIAALGFNVMSSVSNLIGGAINIYLVGEKTGLFNKKDVHKAEKYITTNNKKAYMAVQALGIGRNEGVFSKASKLAKENDPNFHNAFFILQETGDKLVTNTITLSMLNSHTLKEEKISRKSGDEIIYRVVKREKDDKSIIDLMDDNGILDLPSKPSINEVVGDLGDFRSKISKISAYTNGQIIDKADMTNYQGSIWAKLILQFRGWIFQMAKSRFSTTDYDSALEVYSTGRYVSMMNYLLGNSKNNNMGRIKTVALNLSKILMRTVYLHKLSKNPDATMYEIFLKEYEIFANTQKELGLPVDITAEEYAMNNIRNMHANVTELRFLLVAAMLMTMFLKGDDDEDDLIQDNLYLSNLFRRIFMELAFFVDVSSAMNLSGRNSIPLLGTVQTVIALGSDLIGETVGIITNDKERTDNNKPVNKLRKLIPLLREYEKLYYQAFQDEEVPD